MKTRSRTPRHAVSLLAAALCGLSLAACSSGTGTADATDTDTTGASLLIHNVQVVDGTGTSAYAGAVRVADGRIVEVGATFQLLEIGKIDIGIINQHNLDCNKFHIISTLEIHDCFVVGEKYKNLCHNSITLQELSENYPFIMLHKGGNTRAYLDEYFLSQGIHLTPQIELSNLDLILEFTIHGLGVSCVIEEHIKKELSNKTLFKLNIKEKIPLRTLAVITKKDMPLSTAALKFIELIK